jgi:protein-disulfide isomerase
MVRRLQVVVLSFSCCNPQFAAYDRQYVDRLREVVTRTGIEADLNLVTVTEAMSSMTYLYMAEIQPLFKKYGPSVTPALFVDQKLVLFGGVPSEQKLEEVLRKAQAEAGG